MLGEEVPLAALGCARSGWEFAPSPSYMGHRHLGMVWVSGMTAWCPSASLSAQGAPRHSKPRAPGSKSVLGLVLRVHLGHLYRALFPHPS